METQIMERGKAEQKYEDGIAGGNTAVIGYLSKNQREMMRGR